MANVNGRAGLAYLRDILTERFNDEELQNLCFDLGVDYDSLEGESKAGKARELVAFLDRRRCIPDLLKVAERQRPDIDWHDPALESLWRAPVPRGKRLQWVAWGIAGSCLAIIAGLLLFWPRPFPPSSTLTPPIGIVASPQNKPSQASTATGLPSLPTATRMATPVAKPAATQLPLSPGVAPSVQTTLPETITDSTDGAVMVLVPAGPFTMGINVGKFLEECNRHDYPPACPSCAEFYANILKMAIPPHEVTLGAFYIDQYEVTNAQFRECVKAGVCEPTLSDELYKPEKEKHPVSLVTWEQARAYCEDWREGETRLPTEAEWEKAARGTDDRLYPWGDQMGNDRANFCDKNCSLPRQADINYDDRHDGTAPVDSYQDGISPYKVYNMAGNVMEWVQDTYQPYPGSTLAVEGQQLKVMRGGAWYNCAYALGVSIRWPLDPTLPGHPVGIRCARSP